MSDTENLVNWENVYQKSDDFKNQQPFKFGFVPNFFNQSFYDELYSEYPKIDDSWGINSDLSKFQYYKILFSEKKDAKKPNWNENELSNSWALLYKLFQSEEFISNLRKFTGLPVLGLNNFALIAYKKGGFQLPHIHEDPAKPLICFFYFSKDWPKGEAGGTFMATEEDESSIIFEPYDLDNSMALFQDGPFSAHGCRLISVDRQRSALQVTFDVTSE
tara:strand:- start:555 stop:1208 length:654 start_codon:yes stop_codon:yes gene_type:complete